MAIPLNFEFTSAVVVPNPSLSGLYISDINYFRGQLYIVAETQSSSMGSRSYLMILDQTCKIIQIPLFNELRFAGGNFNIKDDKIYFSGKYYEYGQTTDTARTILISEDGTFKNDTYVFPIVSKNWFPNIPIPYDPGQLMQKLNPDIIHNATFQITETSGISIFTSGNMNVKLLPFVFSFNGPHRSICIGFYKLMPLKTVYFKDFDDPYKAVELSSANKLLNLQYDAFNLNMNELKGSKLILVDTINKNEYKLDVSSIDETTVTFEIPDKIPSANYQYSFMGENIMPLKKTFSLKLNNDGPYKNYLKRKANWILIPFVFCAFGIIICLSLLAYHPDYSNEPWNYFSRWNVGIRSVILAVLSIVIGGFAWDWLKYIFDKGN
ncbi:MAG: hypothetical protein IPL74_17655 [Bacteroidetes bacterium]|nr:hypothetical protein [Bacteroidota bacterium]